MDGLNSAAGLGEWVAAELAAPAPDHKHIVRVLTTETDRWFTNGLTPETIGKLAAEPGRTGSSQWDALIEGIVAYRLHIAGLPAPEWTKATTLDEGFDPYDGMVRDLGWHLLNVFDTPAELLGKGVILPASEMELV